MERKHFPRRVAAGAAALLTFLMGSGVWAPDAGAVVQPEISVGDASGLEHADAEAGLFVPVVLSAATTSPVTVSYWTNSGTAAAGSDFSTWGTPTRPRFITIAAGSRQSTINIPLRPDGLTEGIESFTVELGQVVSANATVGRPVGIGTVLDSSAGSLVSSLTVPEGDEPGLKAQFRVEFSSRTATTRAVSYSTSPGTATAGTDYTPARPNTLVFTPGQTSKTVDVLIAGDISHRSDRSFMLLATGDISGSGTANVLEDDAGEVLATIPVGDSPASMASGGSSVWVANFLSNTVTRIDPQTNSVSATIAVPASPEGVVWDGNSIWVTNYGARSVSKIDPLTNTVTAIVQVGRGPVGISSDGSSIWVTNMLSNSVTRIDPLTNSAIATIPVGGWPRGVVWDGSSIWVTNMLFDTVTRIDPLTNTVNGTIALNSSYPAEVTWDGSSLWVSSSMANTVSKIDPQTATVTASIPVEGPCVTTWDGTSVWITVSGTDRVLRVDPATNKVTSSLSVEGSPCGAVWDGSSIWVASANSDSVTRIKP